MSEARCEVCGRPDGAGHESYCGPFKYKGLPFMFARSVSEQNFNPIDKFVVVIAHHDYTHADTAWMNDNSLPSGKVARPSVDICVDGECQFEFNTEAEMIQFVADWFAENYPTKSTK